MKIILSLICTDESILSSQIKLFKKENPNLVEIIGKIDNFFSFK